MRTLVAGGFVASVVLVSSMAGCASAATEEFRDGDCLKVFGPPDRPDISKVPCGSQQSNFKVVGTVGTTDECPSDVDTYYSLRSSFDGSGSFVCMDIDWVTGGCMSIDPENDRDPVRVECDDASAPDRQRATQVLTGVANVDQCGSGLGYAYDERRFTVCVEDVR